MVRASGMLCTATPYKPTRAAAAGAGTPLEEQVGSEDRLVENRLVEDGVVQDGVVQDRLVRRCLGLGGATAGGDRGDSYERSTDSTVLQAHDDGFPPLIVGPRWSNV